MIKLRYLISLRRKYEHALGEGKRLARMYYTESHTQARVYHISLQVSKQVERPARAEYKEQRDRQESLALGW